MHLVRCTFYIRTPAPLPGEYYYERVDLATRHNGELHTPHPPDVGDLIHLWDTVTNRGGTHKVIARRWLHSAYQSANWPAEAAEPLVGAVLEVIVEPADGPFRDQVLRPEEDRLAIARGSERGAGQ